MSDRTFMQNSHKKCLLFRISPVLSCLAECTNRFVPYRIPPLYLFDKLVFDGLFVLPSWCVVVACIPACLSF